LVLTWGCTTTETADRGRIHPVYREMIQEWQMRIQKEGWSESQVHSILFQFRSLATYRMEIRDHWDTPKEFIRKGFSGDCEDITVFMMGTMKRLGYPHRVRILIVHGLFEDHALLRVEMPEGGWKIYDAVPRSVPSRQASLLKPVAEFDEKEMNWFATQAAALYDLKNSNPRIAGQN
jgi:hypothetical protein